MSSFWSRPWACTAGPPRHAVISSASTPRWCPDAGCWAPRRTPSPILDENIVFRTAPGTKLFAALDGAVVGFEVDKIDPVFESGWTVLIQGPSAVITEDDELLRARRLHLRTWAPGERPHYVRIRSASVSGRRFLSPAHALAETWDEEDEARTARTNGD